MMIIENDVVKESEIMLEKILGNESLVPSRLPE
jgi:hypothetical protein